jgi:hypothetical protein
VIKSSVAYVLCRIEDDSSLTPVSQHEDILTGIAAAGYPVKVEDFDFAYALYSGNPSNGSSARVASFREGRIGYRLWATRTGRISPSVEDRYDHDDATRDVCTTCDAVRGWLASGALALLGSWSTFTLRLSAVHASMASDPLRAGVPSAGLRPACVSQWGVGRRNRRSLCRVRTPPRKNSADLADIAYIA